LKGKTKAQTHAINKVQNETVVQKVALRARNLQNNSTRTVFPIRIKTTGLSLDN